MKNDPGDALKKECDVFNGRDWLLALDTSAPDGSVALFHLYSKEVRSARLPTGIRTSRVLLPAIHNLMRGANVRKESIEAVGIALGPGSFTGIRIGLATAKGMVMGLGCPLLGVSSLDALADAALRSCLGKEGPLPDWVLSCRDARHGELFSALYKPLKNQTEEALTVVRAGSNNLYPRDSLPFPPDGKILIAAAKNDLPAGINDGELGSRLMYSGSCISAESVARLARHKMSQGQFSSSAVLQPIYGRKPLAETLWSTFET